MTNELEKKFFDTFGIVAKLDCKRCGAINFALGQCAEVNCEKTYPQITDRILLELICIHNTYIGTNLYSLNYESLKKEILKDLINEQESRELKNDYVSDDMKQEVYTLFKEVES